MSTEKDLKSTAKTIWSTLMNISGVTLWLVIVAAILARTSFVESIFMNQLVYLGLATPAIILGLSSMIAGVILLDRFTPYFDFAELFAGDGLSKLAGAGILAAMLLSLAIVLHGAF